MSIHSQYIHPMRKYLQVLKNFKKYCTNKQNNYKPLATPLEDDSNISAIRDPLAGLQAASL